MHQTPCWQASSSNPLILSSEVHLWQLPLSQPHYQLAVLEALLSPDEITRAEHFAFPQLRAYYVASRGMLRRILGAYTNTTPTELTLAYTEHGKPYLLHSRICF